MTKQILRSLVVLLGSFAVTAYADEAIRENTPAPASVEEDQSILGMGFGDKWLPAIEPGFGKEWVKDLDPFFRDSTLKIKTRSFYLGRENHDSPGNNGPERESWALGGSVEYQSGKLWDVFSFGSEVFTSQKLAGGESRDGASLLATGQEGYTTLGVLNPKFEFANQVVSLYRQKYDLPYVNQQDNRMTPNTFEGYTIGMPLKNNAKFQYVAGYIDQIKRRNDETFNPISEVLGAKGTSKGMPLLGLRYYLLNSWSLGAINYYVDDTLNIFYSETDFKHKLADEVAFSLSAQASEQRSVGDDMIIGKDFSVFFWGIQSGVSYKNATLRAAYTDNDSGSDVRSPLGSYPGYNSSIVEDFNRAGESAWRMGLVYDFKGLGLEGVSAYSNYIHGEGAVDPITKLAKNDKSETDFNIDYKISDGLLKNFWLRFRFANVEEERIGAFQEYRIILNYDFSVI